MKAPEEAKKGLECCILETDDTSLVDHCRACPYQPTGLCFRTLLKDALAYIQRLEAQAPKWISVEERLPENFEERVLVCIEDGNCIIGNPSEDTDRFDPIRKHWVRYGDMVTHWMPLPELPKEG